MKTPIMITNDIGNGSNNELDQITLSDNIFKELRNSDLELAKVPPESRYDDTRSQWHYRIFNTLNWLSFMINEEMITDKKLIDHMNLL